MLVSEERGFRLGESRSLCKGLVFRNVLGHSYFQERAAALRVRSTGGSGSGGRAGLAAATKLPTPQDPWIFPKSGNIVLRQTLQDVCLRRRRVECDDLALVVEFGYDYEAMASTLTGMDRWEQCP